MTTLISADREEIGKDPAAVEALLKTGLAPIPEGIDKLELAAWTSAARAIFNANEFVMRN